MVSLVQREASDLSEIAGGLPALIPAAINVVNRISVAAGERSALRRAIAPFFATLQPHLSENSSLVLHITSAMPGEGVSTVARELALLAGRTPWCNTLLLDGNGSDGGQANHLHSPPLPEIGRGTLDKSSVDTVYVEAREGGFHLASLPMSGTGSADEPEPAIVRQLYARLRATFRLTIVDCPPIMTSPAAAALSGYADGVALVVEAETTRVPVVMRAREEIEGFDGVVRGVIMNKRRYYIPGAIYKLL